MTDVTKKDSRVLFWQTYAHASQELRDALLKDVNLDKNLPLATWKGQVSMLDGAPAEILEKYISKVYYLAQIALYHELPVKRLKVVSKRLDEKAKVKLGLVKKTKSKWPYRSMV